MSVPAPPRSMYMAGDLIDQEVINLISSRTSGIKKDKVNELQRRRRSIKETLFSSRTKKVFDAEVEVTLSELEKQPKIKQMQNEGRSIILVTHDTSTVENFCDSAVVLDHGKLLAQGETKSVIAAYQALP